MSDYRVVTLTCDPYMPLLRGFAWTFNKYWSPNQPVLVGGFTPPRFELPPNFEFHSLGDFRAYPINHYSNALRRLMREIDDDVFVFLLDDEWLRAPVDLAQIQLCIDMIRLVPNMLRVDLIGDRARWSEWTFHNLHVYHTLGNLDFILSDPHTDYQMSISPTILRRTLLHDVIQDGWTPWEVETEGTRRLNELGEQIIVVGTREKLLDCANMVLQDARKHKRGFPKGINAAYIEPKEMLRDDLAEMRRLGIFEPFKHMEHT